MNTSNDIQQQLNRYLEFLRQDPSNINLLLSISNSYRVLNDFATAQKYLDKAKAFDASACFVLQGILALNQQHFKEAKEALTQALHFEDSAIVRYSLAVCHYSLQESIESINILRPLLKSGESTYNVEFLMAQLFHQQGKLDEAIKILEKVLEAYGPIEPTLTLLAQLYFDNEEEKLAENTAHQVLIINPDNYEAQVILLLLHLTHEKVAVGKIKKLMANHPNDSRLWFALGTTYFHSLKLKQAEKAHLKAAELDPDFYDNWISLGWCQLFLEQLEKAENCYQQAATIYEDGAEGWGGLALVSTLQGKFEEAGNLIAKAKKLDTKCLLADIAELCYLQHINPEKVGMYFKQSFPTLAEQLNTAMAVVLEKLNEKKTLH
ncbi:tetratricopeptide repeat protein [Legionella drozanskii]|uniref:Tetratricopeptide repeat protein n=1 Tax=Legionella drozanskii LLAP-1 TaxID=1212489 RepID=A0A0W0SWL9_9GAMM|nr:tetratricopeptide repeat protein [Legionella drozanskii]KTC87758.1 Tetratricopeptide repeat protein [Legionella drozanskii LLAP-1]